MKYKLKNTIFESELDIRCNLCGSDFNFKIINIKSVPHKSIEGCKNENCVSNTTKLKRKEIWKAFLPENEYHKIHTKMYNQMLSNNRLQIQFWTKRGLSEEEAKQKIIEIQSENSKKVKNRFIVSKENLKNNGFTDEQINNICQTPSMISFWIKKGLSEEEAKQKITEHQSNSAKMVDFEKRILPSNIEYWIERGFSEEDSKLKVSESQRTFSKEKCIEKYGEEEGIKIFTEKIEKWQISLNRNGNLKIGYSKISQDIFDEISKRENREYLYATNRGEKISIANENGYEVLVIWDSEIRRVSKQKREEVIQKCIEFLNK